MLPLVAFLYGCLITILPAVYGDWITFAITCPLAVLAIWGSLVWESWPL